MKPLTENAKQEKNYNKSIVFSNSFPLSSLDYVNKETIERQFEDSFKTSDEFTKSEDQYISY